MKRFALSVATCLVVTLAAPAAFAQAVKAAPQDKSKPAATQAAPAAQAPAAPAKYVKPIKGVAAIQTILGKSNKVGNDIVTIVKVKNMSSGSIALLQADEYWYAGKEVVTGDSYRNRKPFNPGEIIEITFRSPYKPGLTSSQYQYSHANGKIDVKSVKKFD